MLTVPSAPISVVNLAIVVMYESLSIEYSHTSTPSAEFRPSFLSVVTTLTASPAEAFPITCPPFITWIEPMNRKSGL